VTTLRSSRRSGAGASDAPHAAQKRALSAVGSPQTGQLVITPSLGRREESRNPARPVTMNPTLHHHYHAQLQADAIRDAYRNPPRSLVEVPEPPAARRRFRLAEALGRVAQAAHRRENLVAVR